MATRKSRPVDLDAIGKLEYLNPDEAAAYTRRSRSTLEKLRMTGGGPPAKADDYPAPQVKAEKPAGKRAAILEAAQRGEIPAAPDFSAPTHARFRKKLVEIVAMVEAGDAAGLKAMTINPVSSPKAMARYRDLAVIAIEANQREDAA